MQWASMQNRKLIIGTPITYNRWLGAVVRFQAGVAAFLLLQGILQFLPLTQVAYQE